MKTLRKKLQFEKHLEVDIAPTDPKYQLHKLLVDSYIYHYDDNDEIYTKIYSLKGEYYLEFNYYYDDDGDTNEQIVLWLPMYYYQQIKDNESLLKSYFTDNKRVLFKVTDGNNTIIQ